MLKAFAKPEVSPSALLMQSTMALHRRTVVEPDENQDIDATAVYTLKTVMERLKSPAVTTG
jgi:hypothetical protein